MWDWEENEQDPSQLLNRANAALSYEAETTPTREANTLQNLVLPVPASKIRWRNNTYHMQNALLADTAGACTTELLSRIQTICGKVKQ